VTRTRKTTTRTRTTTTLVCCHSRTTKPEPQRRQETSANAPRRRRAAPPAVRALPTSSSRSAASFVCVARSMPLCTRSNSSNKHNKNNKNNNSPVGARPRAGSPLPHLSLLLPQCRPPSTRTPAPLTTRHAVHRNAHSKRLALTLQQRTRPSAHDSDCAAHLYYLWRPTALHCGKYNNLQECVHACERRAPCCMEGCRCKSWWLILLVR